MAAIHHQERKNVYAPTPDNHRRQVLTPMRVPSSVGKISFDGAEYEADETGTFYVPPEVADHYLGFPNWFSGENPYPPEVAPEPTRAAKRDAETGRGAPAEKTTRGRRAGKTPADGDSDDVTGDEDSEVAQS